MRRFLLAIVVGSAAFALSLGGACGDGDSTGGEGGEDTANPELADVIYQGGATDEALEALLDAQPTADAAKSASFSSPADGAVVATSPAPTFTWAIGGASGRWSPPKDLERFLDPAGAAPVKSFEGRSASLSGRSLVERFLNCERSAHAHGTPTSGPAFFVVFSTSKDAKLLRIFTSTTTYTPDEAAITKLKGAGEAIHAVITNAAFDQNRIAQDGGPYNGTSITFTAM